MDLTAVGKDGVVVLPSNSDNHPKSTRVTQSDVTKLDTLADLVVSGLQRDSVVSMRASDPYPSPSMASAVERMKQQMLEGAAE